MLERGEQIVDALLAMDTPDPDGVVDAFLLRDGVGGSDFESVGKERALVRADAELVQARLHQGVEVKEVLLQRAAGILPAVRRTLPAGCRQHLGKPPQ